MRFCNAHLCEADSHAFYTWLFYSVGDKKTRRGRIMIINLSEKWFMKK